MPLNKDDKAIADSGRLAESEAMPPQMPPPEEELEPEKFVPGKDHPSYDTPSGRALAEAGAPNPDDAGSDKEHKRGLKYLSVKMKQRWLS